MRRWFVVRTLLVMVGMALLLQGPPSIGVGFGGVTAQGSGEGRASVQAFASSMDDLASSVGAEAFDAGALSFDLAFEDPETIVATVHELIAFEPYHGVLRGVDGTVGSRAGNALDQALVTASFLRDAGYESRIVWAEGDEEVARAVLATMRPRDVQASVDEAAFDAFGDEVERIAPLVASIEAQVAAEVDAAAETLQALVTFEAPEVDHLVDAARAYAWVEYSLDGDTWSDAHPVFGGGLDVVPDVVAALDPQRTFEDEIPTDVQHRFRLQAFVERKIGDALEVTPITSAWEVPAANLYGVARTFAIVPDGLAEAGDASDFEAVAQATTFFIPLLDGDVAPGGQFFDLLGSVVPPEAAVSPMAGVFASVGARTARAAGALGGLGDSGPAESAVALTAVYLDLVSIAPGGEETVHRRVLVDRIGAEARREGGTSIDPTMTDAVTTGALASAHSILLDPGRYLAPYVAGRTFEILAGTGRYLDGILDAIEANRVPSYPSDDVATGEATLGPLTLWEVMGGAPLPPGRVAFRPSPGIVIMSQRIDGTERHVDVVANPTWAVDLSGPVPTSDPRAASRAGTWATRTEALPFEQADQPSSPSFQALAAGDLRRIDGVDDVRALGWPEASVAAIAEDLERGYVVIAPSTASTPEIGPGWWRIDPVTGETLGRGLDGRGNAFLEYLTSFEVSVAITAGFTVYGVDQCTKIPDSTEAGCCIVQNVAIAGVGVGVGVAVGIAANTAEKLGRALIAFGVLDVAGNVGALYIPTFCPF